MLYYYTILLCYILNYTTIRIYYITVHTTILLSDITILYYYTNILYYSTIRIYTTILPPYYSSILYDYNAILIYPATCLNSSEKLTSTQTRRDYSTTFYLTTRLLYYHTAILVEAVL